MWRSLRRSNFMRRLASIAFAAGFAFFISSLSPAAACRCWVGNANTTDEERISVANEIVSTTRYVVVGRINSTVGPGEDNNADAVNLLVQRPATITVENSISGGASEKIFLPASADIGPTIEAIQLGSCPMFWQEGERNLWLLVSGKDGNPALASSCAHSLVRKWLFPEFWEEESE